MDYEKKYKEALEKARQLCAYPTTKPFINDLQDLFPELAESEDEQIRKGIMAMFNKALPNVFQTYGITKEDAIAWLEKQSKPKTDCPQNHQDVNHPNGCIVMEDFNGGEGFYKLHLDHLNKKQIEEIEELVRAWNNRIFLKDF